MEKTIDEMIDFFLFEKGENILVNEISNKAVVLDATEKINEYDDKVIHIKDEIKSGDVITYNGFKHLITSQIDKNNNSYCARMRRCNHKVAFNWTGNVKWFDVIIDTKVMDTETRQYMTLASGKIKVQMQDNTDSRDIKLNTRFINTGRAWKVTGIDKATTGVINFTCDLEMIISYDDIDNEIANRWQYETVHTYVLTIENGTSMQVSLNDIAQVNITVIDNNSSMSQSPALTYLSSDSNIVSVDNTGKLMGINLGTATITCKMTYKPEIFDAIDITVLEEISHLYTISISGETTIYLGLSDSYVSQIYDNGLEVFDKSVVWSIRNQDGTISPAYATITAYTGNSCTVKSSSSSTYLNKYVVLKAELSDDATVNKEFIMQLKSLF